MPAHLGLGFHFKITIKSIVLGEILQHFGYQVLIISIIFWFIYFLWRFYHQNGEKFCDHESADLSFSKTFTFIITNCYLFQFSADCETATPAFWPTRQRKVNQENSNQKPFFITHAFLSADMYDAFFYYFFEC